MMPSTVYATHVVASTYARVLPANATAADTAASNDVPVVLLLVTPLDVICTLVRCISIA
jgi:hypothetical protein